MDNIHRLIQQAQVDKERAERLLEELALADADITRLTRERDEARACGPFNRGDFVRKKSGSWWEGFVVGGYSTEDNPDGVAVQLNKPNGPVQIYPAKALELASRPSGDEARAKAIEEAAKVADELAGADAHLKNLARRDKDATGAFVHAAEEATCRAIAAAIRKLGETGE